MKIFIGIIFFQLYFYNSVTFGMGLKSYSPNDTAYYCFIMDAFNEGGENYIKIRPVQYLSGLNAVIEAKKDGYAEYKIDKVNGDTTWYLHNGNYVDDSNRAEIKFPLSEKVKIYIWSYAFMIDISTAELFNNSYYDRAVSWYKYVYKRPEDNVYVLFEIYIVNGIVTIIQQI